MPSHYHWRMPTHTSPAQTLRNLLLSLTCLVALLAGGCTTGGNTRTPAPRDAVLLISIDAFRPDYLDRGITPHLARVVHEGVRAQWMNPSYPSLTFPNHYSIVTGLRPDHHGIVHNTMHDAKLGTFKLGDRASVGDGRWWDEAEPIWVSVEKSGQHSATMFWPGTEAAIEGVRPWQWRPFDAKVTAQARVDMVLDWLSQPASTRPRFVTLYFDQVDHESHGHGPDSPQTDAAIREVDASIGRLLDGLGKTGELDSVDIVIVSDHGMAPVPAGHQIALEDMVDMQQADVVTSGQVVGIAPRDGYSAAVEARTLGAHPQYDCWRKDQLPPRWHYGTNARIPPIICQMHEGWDALPRAALAQRAHAPDRGSHGYDPALPSMHALFLARGPDFKRGVVIAPFDNVDVYPLLARLLGIAPQPNDGDIAPLLPALKDGKPDQ